MYLVIMDKENRIVLYLLALMLALMGAGVSGLSARAAGGQTAEHLVHHANILSPLLKALSDHEPWGIHFPRTRPDSRYVRFMKRLYKLSTKHERNHEASHLYNTVRLITARQECLDQCGGRLVPYRTVPYRSVPFTYCLRITCVQFTFSSSLSFG